MLEPSGRCWSPCGRPEWIWKQRSRKKAKRGGVASKSTEGGHTDGSTGQTAEAPSEAPPHGREHELSSVKSFLPIYGAVLGSFGRCGAVKAKYKIKIILLLTK